MITRDRQFPITDLADSTTVVTPDHLTRATPVLQLRSTIASVGSGDVEILPQRAFDEGLFSRTQVIACGHLANNAAVGRLYVSRHCFVDAYLPGSGGHFVKSVSDPFGRGRNCLVVGAGTDADVGTACTALEQVIAARGPVLGRCHIHSFSHHIPEPPGDAELPRLIRQRLDSWQGGWMASPFRDHVLRDWMWYYYLTDHPNWGRLIAPVIAGSIPRWREDRRLRPDSYHCLFNLHSFVHLWDLIEDSLLYSREDRRGVAAMFAELLCHLQDIFYMSAEANPPGLPRQNHSTFIALNLAVGHAYLSRRYGVHDFARGAARAAEIFAGQADSYKPADDAGVGYAWLAPQSTLNYLLFENDYRYVDDGPVRDLCTLAILTTDNMRSEVGYGDASGYAPFTPTGWEGRLWPLLVSTWSTRDPESLWALNWLAASKAPQVTDAILGLYAAVEPGAPAYCLPGCEPREPERLKGVSHLPLPPAILRLVRHAAPPAFRPAVGALHYDKLSLRRSFDPEDEYLLLEGCGTLGHGHEDANAILRLTWRSRAWLADGDYIRAAAKFHNSVVIGRDGIGVLEFPGDGLTVPPLATLTQSHDSDQFGLVQSEVSGYNGMDWQRNLIWAKGRYIAVLDRLVCRVDGTYDCRCLWRLIGKASRRGATTALEQRGAQLFLHNGDGAVQDLVVDAYEPGFWVSYPYADPAPVVLHQCRSESLATGDQLVYMNLLTPHDGVRFERLAPGVARVVDGRGPTVMGTGPARLGPVEVEGEFWAIAAGPNSVELYGVTEVHTRDRHLSIDGPSLRLGPGEPWHAELSALSDLPAAGEENAVPTPGHERPAAVSGAALGLEPAWERPYDVDLNAVHTDGDLVLVSTVDSRLELLEGADGRPVWRQDLEEPATAVRLAPLQGGPTDAIIGTADGVAVLSGRNGSELWRQPLRGMFGRSERTTALAVADLDGSGAPSVLAANAGWYVGAFTASGQPLWAHWFRYHAITVLLAADADGDGRAEVMAGNVYSTPLTVHNSDGSFRWSTFEEVGSEGNATTARRGVCTTRMALLQPNASRIRNIAYGTADGWVFVVEPRAGREIWHAQAVAEVTGLIPLAGELVVASEFGDLHCFTAAGERRWRRRAGRWIRNVALSDELVVVACDSGRLRLYDRDGGLVGAGEVGAEVVDLQAVAGGVVCQTADRRLLRLSSLLRAV